MKKSIIFIVISIFSFQFLTAQNYIPLAVEGAHWVIVYNDQASVEPVDDLWEYHATGDTLINDLSYKKVFKRDLVVTQGEPPFEAEGPYELCGVIRDDSIARKVYAIKYDDFDECPENQEYLLYNFAQNIGDTLNLCIIPTWSEFVINNISSQDVFGFNTRVYSGNFEWDEIYEGMGSHFGLFELMFIPVEPDKTNIYGVTGLYFYCRESPCWLFVSTQEKLESESIHLFPNPASNFIYISNKNENIYSISVFNNLGQLVMRENGDLNKIDVKELKPGLYNIELTTNNTRIQKKIIIE